MWARLRHDLPANRAGDCDHISAEIRQDAAAEGPGADALELEHADAGERSRHCLGA
eukprot:COSAG04_NODE_12578_length_646_cov_0.720293_1_plen_56_part_00